MTWAVILPLIKKSGPYILILVALFGLYRFGFSRGADKWESQYDHALEQRDMEHAAAVRAANELAVVKDALERQSNAIREMEEDHAAQLESVNRAHDAALRRQAEAHRRAELERYREAENLRERMRLMTVAEACHEAWLEVMR
jgi:hypothetical protein